MTTTEHLDRDTAIKAIRAALKQRSGKAWSVRGGTGTAWGWLAISAPPRRMEGSWMSAADSAELRELLGMDWNPRPDGRSQSISVPASSDHYREYVDRAEGRAPSVVGVAYWD